MKKLFIKMLTALVAVIMVFSLTGCDKVVKLQFTLSVYDVDKSSMVDKTITYSMYENLAPVAVKEVKRLVKDGYYDNAIFYKQSTASGTSVGSQMFFGGLNRNGGVITQAEKVAIPRADFKQNGTDGTNLTNKEGYLGLWRTWDTTKTFRTNGFENSYSTMYIPTSDLSSYDGYFCVFAKYASEDDLSVLQMIKSLLGNSEYTTEYTCWFECDSDGRLVTENEAPVWHITATEDFDDVDANTVYTSDKDPDQNTAAKDTAYDKYTVTLVNADRLVIKSVKV